MNKPITALVPTVLLIFAGPLLAAPQGGAAAVAPTLAAAGPAYAGGRAGPGGAHPGARPLHGAYHGHPGWHGGYWGPRVSFYYGGPGYWAGWPWAWGAWSGAWGPPYGYYGYGTAPIVVYDTAQPQSYVQQEAPAGAAPQAAPEASYWYYCTEPAGYFPYVKECKQPWLKVLPQAPSEQPTAPRVVP